MYLLAGDYKNLLFRLLRLRPENHEELHPKLIEVRTIVLRHLQSDKSGRKIWIRLYRHSNDIAARIHHILTEVDVLCEVDPQIVYPESVRPFLPSGNYPVIVAERTPKDFPPSMLSLIIHYELPSKSTVEMDGQFSNVAQKAIVVNRPARLEGNISAPEAIQISVSISTPISDPNLLTNTSPPLMCMDGIEIVELRDTSTMKPTKDYRITAEVHQNADADAESLADSYTESQHFVEEKLPEPEELGTNADMANVPSPVVEMDADQKPLERFVERLPIILSAALTNNAELMEAFLDNAGNLTIHEVDYR